MGLYTPPPAGTPPPPLFGAAESQQPPFMRAWMLPMDYLGDITGMTGKIQQMRAQAGASAGAPGIPSGTPGLRRQPVGNIGGGAGR
jgi:hypothetical protein